MSDFKHTPGPWLLETNGTYVHFVQSEGGGMLAKVFEFGPNGTEEDQLEAKANGRLIAAAPEMLALLERIVKGLGPESARESAREILANLRKDWAP